MANYTSSNTGAVIDTAVDDVELLVGAGLAKDATFTKFVSLGTPIELTIAAGVITATSSYHKVDTQSDDATDDLDTINGGSAGNILVLRAQSDVRDVVVKDGTGNIQLAGNADFTLDHSNDKIGLIFDGANWTELFRASNTA